MDHAQSNTTRGVPLLANIPALYFRELFRRYISFCSLLHTIVFMVPPLKSLFLQSVFLPLWSVQILFIMSSCYWCSQRQCFSSVSGRVTISDVCSLFCIITWLLKLKPFTWKALGYEVKGFGRRSKINNKWGKLFWQRDISYVSKPEGEEGVTVRSQGTSRVPHLVCEMTGFSSRGGEEDGWTWRCCIGRIAWIC